MIKFRAWDKNENRYFIDGNAGRLGNLICCNDWDMFDPDDYVWEQFTGLKDASGKDVYEGDIVEVTSQYWGMLGNRYEVKFTQGAFYVKYGLLSEISPSISVIGNMHTNPELLEDKL